MATHPEWQSTGAAENGRAASDQAGAIAIIVLNYNGKKWLQACLDSISSQTYKNFKTFVVDNASSDGSADFVRSNFPWVTIIANDRNLGYGNANNNAAKAVEDGLLFFLNNDTKLKEDALERLVSFRKRSGWNIIGASFQDYEGNYVSDNGTTIDVLGSPAPGKHCFYVEGAALLISKNDFATLGGFDPQYFMYGEDVDLCWRARLYGMKLGVCKEAVVRHYFGGSSHSTVYGGGKHTTSYFRRYEVDKNGLRNILKNYRLATLLCVLPLWLGQFFGETFIYLCTGNTGAVRTIWRAAYWNLSHIGDTAQQRRRIQAARVLGDWAVISKMSPGLNKLKGFLTMGLPRFAK